MRRNVSQTIRNNLFWFVDYLKGQKIANDYREISTLLNGQGTPSALKAKYLSTILNHAIQHVPNYQKYLGAKSLNEFPVVNKMILKARLSDFVSSSKYGKLIRVTTSGSTGTPFLVYHDKRKKTRNSADALYFSMLAGYEVGNRLAYLKIWAKEKMASSLHYWLQNVQPIDVIALKDQQIEDLIRGMENDRSVYGMLGYTSAFELVCKYLDRNKWNQVNARVNSIITMSESLNDYVKTSMEKYFGTETFSRYSNLENGIIAQQIPGSETRYLINTASYVVEILELDSEKSVPRGQLGRIVVTDLFNFAMPMIRYDTGDVGVLSEETDEAGNLYLEVVEGRKLDLLYDTRGSIVSSYIVYKNMWKYLEIDQYQLVQKSVKRYVLKINIKRPFEKEDQLIREFKSYLGEDSNFLVEYVDEIPLLDSGKRKKIVNEMLLTTKDSGRYFNSNR